MTIAAELARRIGAITFADLPPEAVAWAKVGILDTVGVTLAGAGESCARIVSGVAAHSAGPALLFGTRRCVAPLDAALINGTAAHALDFDDCSNSMGGHPSAPVLPALFALAGTRKVSGREFIAAYVAGFETETRIARGVNFHHYEKGWHPTATLGTFGAAAASARLLGLDAGRTAIALATSCVAGVGHQGQLRHHDETAARRPCRPQRTNGGAAGGRRLHGERRRLRARPGLLPGVQRRRQLLGATPCWPTGPRRSTS